MKNTNAVLEKVKQTHPQLVRGIPDARLQRIARALFAAIGEDITALEKGQLRVPGLGTFRVRTVEIEKDNRKYSAKRVKFALPKPRGAKKGKKAAQDSVPDGSRAEGAN